MNMRGYFFHPSKKKQRDLDYQACSSDMVGYFFQGFNFFFFEKNTHACSSDMRVILPYTAQNAATARPLEVWVIKASADTNGKNHPSEQKQKRGRLKKNYGKSVKQPPECVDGTRILPVSVPKYGNVNSTGYGLYFKIWCVNGKYTDS